MAVRFVPRFTARYGEKHSAGYLWCAYQMDWLSPDSFSADQRAAPRNARYSLNWSSQSDRSRRAPSTVPTDERCLRHWQRLSDLGKSNLALSLGDGDAAEELRRAEWDEQDDRARDARASGDLFEATSQLRHIEQNIPDEEVTNFSAVAWRAALGVGKPMREAERVKALAKALSMLVSSLKAETKQRAVGESHDAATMLTELRRLQGAELRLKVVMYIKLLYDNLDIENQRCGMPLSTPHE